MEKLIKRFVPNKLFQFLKRLKYRKELKNEYCYLEDAVLHYSRTFIDDIDSQLASLMVETHVLEKGITMPERRLGFGEKRVRNIIESCEAVIRKNGSEYEEVQVAISDLYQYLEIHNEAEYQLPKDIVQGIEWLKQYLKETKKCWTVQKENYFKKTNDFKEFAESRHSVRWFSKTKVDNQILLNAIHLAQTAPSACNRQATRVKIISSDNGKRICCKYQNGNRGFGENADKWLLITTDLRAWSHKHIDIALVDAGIFTMNLLYSLHYYKIVACTLNAHFDSKKCKEFCKEIGIPEAEIPVAFIVIGNAEDNFMIPQSARLGLERIIQNI